MTGLSVHQTATRKAALQNAAGDLMRAERTCRPIPPLSHSIPDLSEAEAYVIAQAKVSASGSARVGYKLGYTSAAMRSQMGISEPNYGILLAGAAVRDSDTIPLECLIHPLVEPELAFLMKHDLAGSEVCRDEAWQAVESVMGSIEIVDTRYETYRFRATDNIADNSSAARFVLGEMIKPEDAGDLARVRVRLLQDGVCIDSGVGNNAMGDPVLALVWLARKLVETESRIKAGELVMTGGLTKAHAVEAGSVFAADFDRLGTVHARF